MGKYQLAECVDGTNFKLGRRSGLQSWCARGELRRSWRYCNSKNSVGTRVTNHAHRTAGTNRCSDCYSDRYSDNNFDNGAGCYPDYYYNNGAGCYFDYYFDYYSENGADNYAENSTDNCSVVGRAAG